MQFLTVQEVLQIRLVSQTFNQGALMHLSERIVEEEKSIENLIVIDENHVHLNSLNSFLQKKHHNLSET